MDPVPTLLARVRAELAVDFRPDRPIRISRAPGRLDVMGGIADYTGSLVCEATLNLAAAVALQGRDDRFVQVFSFNLFDDHRPFTFRIPLDALAEHSADTLRKEFNQSGRRWAGYLAGCLFMLHEQGFVDLKDPTLKGVNIALYSTVALGAGISSSAAIEVATMMNLADHYGVARGHGRGNRGDARTASDQEFPIDKSAATDDGLRTTRSVNVPDISATGRTLSPLSLASMCQQVENRIVGAPCGIMDQVSSCFGEAGSLLRMVCQPHEIQPALHLPAGVRVMGINSNVNHSVGGGMYGRTRCAAFMGHKMILENMRTLGARSGHQLTSDPMGGYLANLSPDDYKNLFRPHLPEHISGADFLRAFGATVDTATQPEPDQHYHVRSATDHHVLEAMRVRNFVGHLEDAARSEGRERKLSLDKAGHLMYASHLSYTNDAKLGADECDLLVKLVRDREHAGLYGAKITGGGSGGTVAILVDVSPTVDSAIVQIMTEYEKQTGKHPEAFTGTSPGAWHWGTEVVDPV